MAYKVKTSTFARDDRRSIVKYLSQYSVNAPDKFRNELTKYIDIIGQSPEIFSKYYANPTSQRSRIKYECSCKAEQE